MNLPHRPAVDADDAAGRRLANVARMAAALCIVLFVFCVGAWQLWNDASQDERPLSLAADVVAADAAPTLRVIEPNEHDYAQRPYVTHGG